MFIIPQEIRRHIKSQGIFFPPDSHLFFFSVPSLVNSTTSSEIKFPPWSNTWNVVGNKASEVVSILFLFL